MTFTTIPSPVVAYGKARNYLGDKIEHIIARLLARAFRSRVVQEAIANEIKCGTPLGDLYNDAINEAMDGYEVNASDIRGLDREIEDALNHMNSEIDVDNIKHFDDAVGEAVRSALEDQDVVISLADDIMERIAKRLASA